MNMLELATAIGVDGFLHCDEFWKLIELAANKDVLEVGAYRGLSAYGMCISAKSVLSVDRFTAATDGQRDTGALTTLDAYNKAVSRFNNVRPPVVASSASASEILRGELFDLILIDAMHTYPEVRDDIQRWWPKLRNGGTMAFHDYRHSSFPDVERAIDEIFGPAPEGTTCVTLRWVVKPA